MGLHIDFRLGLGSQAGGSTAPPAPADFIITNDAEWTTFAARPASEMSGKVAELNGTFSRLALSGKSPAAFATIRTASGTTVPGFDITSCDNLRWSGSAQMTGWPFSVRGIIGLYGTNGDIEFDGATFRHGYGSGHVDLTAAVVDAAPEIVRNDHNLTATTSSVAYALTWENPAMTYGGIIEFFNNGAATVYAKVGNSGVTATTGDTACPAGVRTRLSATPSTSTHIAILAASGTVSVNARAEIGLVQYIADAFVSDGSTTIENITIKNCTFLGVCSAVKSMGNVTGKTISWKNNFPSVYADIHALGLQDVTSEAYVLQNRGNLPLAKSGITASGDAGDPHGDLFQAYTLAAPIHTGAKYSADNIYLPNGRAGTSCQGNFISDGAYQNFYSIADLLIGGAPRGIDFGDPTYVKSGYAYIDGCTAINLDAPTSESNINIDGNTTTNNAVYRSISQAFPTALISALADNLDASSLAIFADATAAKTATTVDALTAALTVGSSSGAADMRSALINDGASSYDTVIKWENTRPGLSWPVASDLTASTLYTSPLRKVLAGVASMAITANAGTEYQITSDAAGASVLTAWTTSPGTVSRGNFVQVRGTTSATAGADAGLGVTIAGHACPMNALTLEQYFTMSGVDTAFVDPATTFATTVSKFTMRLKFRNPVHDTAQLFQINNRLYSVDLINGTSPLSIREGGVDSANTTIKTTAVVAANALAANTIHDLLYTIDLAQNKSRFYLNGVLLADTTIGANSGAFGTAASKIYLLRTASGTPSSIHMAGQIFHLEFWRNEEALDGVRPSATPYFELHGDAATANASSWKVGTNVT